MSVEANEAAESQLSIHAASSRKRLIDSFVVRNRLGKDDSNIFEVSNSVVVSTELDGYNSGRQYQFHSDSQDVRGRLVAQLRKLAAESRKREAGKTRFHKSQERLGRVVNSIPFQTILALIILAVSSYALISLTANL